MNQSVEDYADELYRQAEEINPELRQLTERMAALTNGEAGFRDGLKGRPRALDKMREYELEDGANPSHLVDIAGSKIVYDSLDSLYKGLDRIRKEIDDIPNIDIVRIKDRFINPQTSGYRDILMNLKMTNEHIAEFRLHLKQFDAVAKSEHDLYDVTRAIRALADQAGREITLAEDTLISAIQLQTRKLYDKALEKALGE